MGENYITDDGKMLHAIRSRTIREMVNKANELKILRSDIVSVLQENGVYVLLYYYKGV